MGVRVYRWAALLAMACVWAPLLFGCGPGESSPDRVKIGFLVKQAEEPWFQNEWKFARQAAETHGFDLVEIGAPDGEKVLTAIDNLAAQGAQGFVICTPDVRLGPAIVSRAQSHGLKVFAVDDQLVNAEGRPMDVPYMGISAREIGEQVGQALWDEARRRGWNLEETGAAAITFDELNTSRERTEGAIAALTAAGFPPERVFRSPEKTTDTEGGFNAMNTLLTQHPEIKRWMAFSLNDEGVMGAVRAMEGRGFAADSIVGVGIGGSTCLVEFEKPARTGFHATCLISPKRHGYETAEYLYKWIRDGVEPPKDTRTKGMIITRENYRQVMQEQGLL